MKWILILASSVAALLVVSQPTQAGLPATYFNCGTANRVGAHTWGIRTVQVSCATAVALVRRVAVVTLSSNAKKPVKVAGTYSGMRCLAAPAGGKPQSITCAKTSGAGLVLAMRLR